MKPLTDDSFFPERGTFTPTLFGSTTAGSHSPSQEIGRFTRVGDMICFTLYLAIGTKDNTMAGAVRVGGLPVAAVAIAAGGYSPVAISFPQHINAAGQLAAYVAPGADYIVLRDETLTTTGTGSNIQAVDIGANPAIMLAGHYFAA